MKSNKSEWIKTWALKVTILALIVAYIPTLKRSLFTYSWRSLDSNTTRSSIIRLVESFKRKGDFDGAPINDDEEAFLRTLIYLCNKRCNKDNFLAFPHIPIMYRWTKTLSRRPTVSWIDVTSRDSVLKFDKLDLEKQDYVIYADLDLENYIGQERAFNSKVVIQDDLMMGRDILKSFKNLSFMSKANAYVSSRMYEGEYVPLLAYKNIVFLARINVLDKMIKMSYLRARTKIISHDKSKYNLRGHLEVSQHSRQSPRIITWYDLKNAYSQYGFKNSLYFIYVTILKTKMIESDCILKDQVEAIQLNPYCIDSYTVLTNAGMNSFDWLSYVTEKTVR